MRFIAAMLLVAAVTVTTGPATADHTGMFDLAALQDRHTEAQAPADDHWLARLRSWLARHAAAE